MWPFLPLFVDLNTAHIPNGDQTAANLMVPRGLLWTLGQTGDWPYHIVELLQTEAMEMKWSWDIIDPNFDPVNRTSAASLHFVMQTCWIRLRAYDGWLQPINSTMSSPERKERQGEDANPLIPSQKQAKMSIVYLDSRHTSKIEHGEHAGFFFAVSSLWF